MKLCLGLFLFVMVLILDQQQVTAKGGGGGNWQDPKYLGGLFNPGGTKDIDLNTMSYHYLEYVSKRGHGGGGHSGGGHSGGGHSGGGNSGGGHSGGGHSGGGHSSGSHGRPSGSYGGFSGIRPIHSGNSGYRPGYGGGLQNNYYGGYGYYNPIYIGGYNRPSVVFCEKLYQNGYGWGPRVSDGRWVYGRCSDYDY